MNSRIGDAQNYLDINGLNDLRVQSNSIEASDKNEALKKAAKQFEAIFMQMLLKSMRSAQEVLESDSPFNSESTKFYRDMHDQQMALEMSNNGSLGLSELIVRQLGGDQDTFTPSSVLRTDSTQTEIMQIKQDLRRKLERQTTDTATNTNPVEDNALHKRIRKVEQQSFEQPKDFVTALTEPAKQVQAKLNVPFEVVIAQAALETGWAKKSLEPVKAKARITYLTLRLTNVGKVIKLIRKHWSLKMALW